MVGVADIDAMLDVLTDLGEQADASPEVTAPIYEALTRLGAHVTAVKGLFESGLKNGLEQPQVIGARLYAAKPDGKWRPDHQAIKSNIISTAILDRETGERRDAEDAARLAVELTYGIFVAEKSDPKVTGLKAIGFADKRAASEWEHTGKTLVVTDLGYPDGAA